MNKVHEPDTIVIERREVIGTVVEDPTNPWGKSMLEAAFGVVADFLRREGVASVTFTHNGLRYDITANDIDRTPNEE